MTILARVKPSWPVIVQGTGGITVSQSNGRALIGFDYNESETGSELNQAIDAANSAADTALAAAASIPGKASDADMDAAVDDKYTTPEKNVYIIIKNKKYIDVEDKGAIIDSNTSSASVNAQAMADAISALGSNGGRIIVPTGGIMYIDDALINLTARKGIEICGYGSSSGQSTFATRIIYTPSSGSLVRLNNCQSIIFRHLSLYYSAADYSGTFIDLRGTLAANTSFILFDDFEIGGTNSSSKNALLVDVSNSYKSTFNNGYIRNGYYGIVGARQADKSDFCNKTLINDVEFDAALQVPVVAGGMNWEVNSCIFEPPKGAAGGLDAIMASPWGLMGLKVSGTQFADAGASAGSWINLESDTDFGSPGTIQTVHIGDANVFQCGSHATSGFAIDLGATKGGSVTNNYFNKSNDIGFIIHNGSSGIIVEGNTPHTSGGPGVGKIWASVDYPTGLSRVADTQGDGFKITEKVTFSGASNAHAAFNFGPYNGVPTSPVVGDILFNGTTFQWRLSAGWVTAATTNSNLGIFAATTSAQLRGIISDETGTGALVFATSPALVTPDLGVATATSINGVALDNNAWSAYTPTITANSGTYTTVSATGRYKQIGKTVICEGTVTTTDIGTGTGATYVTLPVTAKSATAYAGSGYIKSTAAGLSVGIFDTDATHIRLYTASGGTAAANGLLLNFTITYEAA